MAWKRYLPQLYLINVNEKNGNPYPSPMCCLQAKFLNLSFITTMASPNIANIIGLIDITNAYVLSSNKLLEL